MMIGLVCRHLKCACVKSRSAGVILPKGGTILGQRNGLRRVGRFVGTLEQCGQLSLDSLQVLAPLELNLRGLPVRTVWRIKFQGTFETCCGRGELSVPEQGYTQVVVDIG